VKLNWKNIKTGFDNSLNKIEVFEKNNETHYDSPLDIVVNNASLIIVNNYLRVLCSGETEYEHILQFNDKFKIIIGEKKYAIAYDVFGGIFAITERGISYFSPDNLSWEDLEISYEGFITWISTKNINEFYESFLWKDSDLFIKDLKLNEGITMYPFLWAKECDVNTATKRIIPYAELLVTNYEFCKEFNCSTN